MFFVRKQIAEAEATTVVSYLLGGALYLIVLALGLRLV